MSTHSFILTVEGIPLEGPYEDRLYKAGCDDTTISVRKGKLELAFEREAPTYDDALHTATQNVKQAGGHVVAVRAL